MRIAEWGHCGTSDELSELARGGPEMRCPQLSQYDAISIQGNQYKMRLASIFSCLLAGVVSCTALAAAVSVCAPVLIPEM
jgi:hypothetical protein